MAGPIAQHHADACILWQAHRAQSILDSANGIGDLAPAIVAPLEIQFDAIGIERHDRAQFFGHKRHQSASPPLASIPCPVTQRASSPSTIITAPATLAAAPRSEESRAGTKSVK